MASQKPQTSSYGNIQHVILQQQQQPKPQFLQPERQKTQQTKQPHWPQEIQQPHWPQETQQTHWPQQTQWLQQTHQTHWPQQKQQTHWSQQIQHTPQTAQTHWQQQIQQTHWPYNRYPQLVPTPNRQMNCIEYMSKKQEHPSPDFYKSQCGLFNPQQIPKYLPLPIIISTPLKYQCIPQIVKSHKSHKYFHSKATQQSVANIRHSPLTKIKGQEICWLLRYEKPYYQFNFPNNKPLQSTDINYILDYIQTKAQTPKMRKCILRMYATITNHNFNINVINKIKDFLLNIINNIPSAEIKDIVQKHSTHWRCTIEKKMGTVLDAIHDNKNIVQKILQKVDNNEILMKEISKNFESSIQKNHAQFQLISNKIDEVNENINLIEEKLNAKLDHLCTHIKATIPAVTKTIQNSIDIAKLARESYCTEFENNSNNLIPKAIVYSKQISLQKYIESALAAGTGHYETHLYEIYEYLTSAKNPSLSDVTALRQNTLLSLENTYNDINGRNHKIYLSNKYFQHIEIQNQRPLCLMKSVMLCALLLTDGDVRFQTELKKCILHNIPLNTLQIFHNNMEIFSNLNLTIGSEQYYLNFNQMYCADSAASKISTIDEIYDLFKKTGYNIGLCLVQSKTSEWSHLYIMICNKWPYFYVTNLQRPFAEFNIQTPLMHVITLDINKISSKTQILKCFFSFCDLKDFKITQNRWDDEMEKLNLNFIYGLHLSKSKQAINEIFPNYVTQKPHGFMFDLGEKLFHAVNENGDYSIYWKIEITGFKQDSLGHHWYRFQYIGNFENAPHEWAYEKTIMRDPNGGQIGQYSENKSLTCNTYF